jgi:undecaprenyl-diphosphatase
MAFIGGLVPFVLKNIFQRTRPTDGLMVHTGYSFPSGHTMGVLALYGLLIILVMLYFRKDLIRNLLLSLFYLLIPLIAWSRIHLGVHYPSDILGSFFLGSGLLLIARLILIHAIDHKRSQTKLYFKLPT